jgi:alkylation response protein AidB-like acyl-CoA dehydrogenase
MYFDLTDDQKMLREQVAGMLSSRLDDSKLMKLYNAEDSFDEGLWRELTGMGLAGILASADKGGLGMDMLTLAVVADELGSAAAPVPLVANAIAAWLLAQSDDYDKDVVALISGDAVASFAFSSLEAQDSEAWAERGEQLSAEFDAVEWGSRATIFIIVGLHGQISVTRRDDPGVSVVPVDTVDRTRPISRLVLENARTVSLEFSASTVQRLLDALAVTYASDACGAAHRTLKMALEYSSVRKQFDKLIGQFQGLKFQLVNMAVEVHPCRPLSWYAAHTWDAVPDQSARMAAIAKAHITEVAVRTGRGCIEAHGGIGYTWEYPLHVWLKRAMHDRAMLGQPSIHRSRSAALADW